MIDDVIPNLGAYKTIRVRKRTKLAITPNDKLQVSRADKDDLSKITLGIT